MRGRQVFWAIVYYLIVLAVYWYLDYEGPPLRVVMWHHVARGSQSMARTFGRIGIRAESNYYAELERTRG